MPLNLPANPPSTYFQNIRREIAPLLPSQINNILELGCGSGNTMAWVKSLRHVRYSMGVELSATAAVAARKNFDELYVGDIEVAPDSIFATHYFDTILALDVLEHLRDPLACVMRLSKRLQPGGVFIASLPNIAHYHVSLPLFLFGRWQYANEGLLDRTHLRFFTKQTATDLFHDAGLRVIAQRSNRIFPNIFLALGLTSGRWQHYSTKLLSKVARGHLFDYQFLIAASRDG
jgi:SAM-dependent methyltransferase